MQLSTLTFSERPSAPGVRHTISFHPTLGKYQHQQNQSHGTLAFGRLSDTIKAFYRDPDNPARTFAVYASGTSRLYALSQPSLRLFFPQYMPYPMRVVS
jgi:hypothetical protein